VTDVEMAPILIRKDAFQIVQTGRFWLSESPRKPGSKSWDAVFARTAAWAELRHPRFRPLADLPQYALRLHAGAPSTAQARQLRPPGPKKPPGGAR